MQALFVKPVACPFISLTSVQVAAPPLDLEAFQPPPHVVVNLDELRAGVPRPKVVAPAAQHRVEVSDEHPHVLHPKPVTASQVPDSLAHPFHTALTRPAMQIVAA